MKTSFGRSPNRLIQEYLGSDFDIVKAVYESLDSIKQLTENSDLNITDTILNKLGHNVVGSFEEGGIINSSDDLISYKGEMYHYIGTEFPYEIPADSSPTASFKKGYRGSADDWNAFDKALQNICGIQVLDPDTVGMSHRLHMLLDMGLLRPWKEGGTVTKDEVILFGLVQYQAIRSAVMGSTPVGDADFKQYSVTTDDIGGATIDEVKRIQQEVLDAVDSINADKDVITTARDEVVRLTEQVLKHSADLDIALEEATNAATEAKLSEVESKKSEIVVLNAETDVQAKHADVVAKHADVVTKHSEIKADVTRVDTLVGVVNTAHADVVSKHTAIVTLHRDVIDAQTQVQIDANESALNAASALDSKNTAGEYATRAETAFKDASELYAGMDEQVEQCAAFAIDAAESALIAQLAAKDAMSVSFDIDAIKGMKDEVATNTLLVLDRLNECIAIRDEILALFGDGVFKYAIGVEADKATHDLKPKGFMFFSKVTVSKAAQLHQFTSTATDTFTIPFVPSDVNQLTVIVGGVPQTRMQYELVDNIGGGKDIKFDSVLRANLVCYVVDAGSSSDYFNLYIKRSPDLGDWEDPIRLG